MKRKSIDAVLIVVGIFSIFTWSFMQVDRYDVVIKNGNIVDGTGKPAYKADIGINGGIIEKIGKIPSRHAKTSINASGKIVAPGFIDIHTHADVVDDPKALNYVMQGVTTVVSGNCGGSALELESLFDKISKQGTSINFATYIGHNTIREKVMGSSDKKPTPAELDSMKDYIASGMKAGAVGLSTGLVYHPGMFSATDEIVELAKEAAKYKGIYATHLRSEGEAVLESVREAIEIGEKARIPVQISHLKVLIKFWGHGRDLIALIDSARAIGIDVAADQYPYTASSTGLGVLIPPWAFEGEGWKKKAENPTLYNKIINDTASTILHQRAGTEFNRIQIASYSPDRSIEGKGLADILAERGIENNVGNAARLVLDILSKGNASAVYHSMIEEDVEMIISHPYVMHGSDGHITKMNVGVPHPRCYGTFPRVLGVYVHDKGIISLEEAIRKMTSLPASRLGIENCGTLVESKCADLVIFDSEKIRDNATFTDPHQYPTGIEHVFVNGVSVVDENGFTGAFPGTIIKGRGTTAAR